MAPTKLIVVVGATGNQGGSVAKTFAQDPAWRVRGLTRNPSSSKAQALKNIGIEVVQADIDDVSSLVEVFKGANAIFTVSDFWGTFNDPATPAKVPAGMPQNKWVYEYEVQQLKNMIDAAAQTEGLERLVYSTLSDGAKWSKGKYKNILHFVSKAHASYYGAEKYPELWKKTSTIQVGWYLSNLTTNPILQPEKNSEGVTQFIMNLDGDLHLPIVAPEEDTGPFTKALVEEKPGKNLIAYRQWMTMKEFVKLFTEAVGRPAEYVQLPIGQFAVPIPEELKDELNDNWGYWNEFGYEGRDDPTVIHPRDLETKVKLDTVGNWLKKQDWSKILDA
ncbi:hypothetical protein F5884DRAFT_658953 [Xylogone sp. PMI_703]|nr:hypothetical protein F5884DRAFT_658953 [Xylogone sp. PMI_703]